MTLTNSEGQGAAEPDVSVIIPAHDAAGWVADAIASVRDQELDATVEILVVDDGSTDETVARVQAMDGPDLRLVRRAQGGPSAARNTALAAARGRLVYFLDADDVALPGGLAALVGALRDDPGAGFAHGDALVLDADGTEMTFRSFDGPGPLLDRLVWGNCLATGTILVRADMLRQAGGSFAEALTTGEDWDLWLRLASLAPAVHVAHPVARIRRTPRTDKYPLAALERCTLAVLDRLFAADRLVEWPHVQRQRRRIYAWHRVVLAKARLRHGQPLGAIRMAVAAVTSHPAAVLDLLGVWPPVATTGLRRKES